MARVIGGNMVRLVVAGEIAYMVNHEVYKSTFSVDVAGIPETPAAILCFCCGIGRAYRNKDSDYHCYLMKMIEAAKFFGAKKIVARNVHFVSDDLGIPLEEIENHQPPEGVVILRSS